MIKALYFCIYGTLHVSWTYLMKNQYIESGMYETFIENDAD